MLCSSEEADEKNVWVVPADPIGRLRKGMVIKMKKGLKICKFLYFFTCFFVLLGNTSFAYIDPSAVTYVIQAVAGVLIALGAAATVYRHKIMKFFRQQKRKKAKRDKKAEQAEQDIAGKEE